MQNRETKTDTVYVDYTEWRGCSDGLNGRWENETEWEVWEIIFASLRCEEMLRNETEGVRQNATEREEWRVGGTDGAPYCSIRAGSSTLCCVWHVRKSCTVEVALLLNSTKVSQRHSLGWQSATHYLNIHGFWRGKGGEKTAGRRIKMNKRPLRTNAITKRWSLPTSK